MQCSCGGVCKDMKAQSGEHQMTYVKCYACGRQSHYRFAGLLGVRARVLYLSMTDNANGATLKK